MKITILQKSVLTFVVFALLFGFSTTVCSAQNNQPSLLWQTSDKPRNCEGNLALLEELAIKASVETKEQNTVLIAIARLGDGDKRSDLSRRRLHNISVKLKNNRDDISWLITAEGERVKGFGRVEFYLQGKLVGVLITEKNRDLCVDCCGLDPRYYPDKTDNAPKVIKGKKRR